METKPPQHGSPISPFWFLSINSTMMGVCLLGWCWLLICFFFIVKSQQLIDFGGFGRECCVYIWKGSHQHLILNRVRLGHVVAQRFMVIGVYMEMKLKAYLDVDADQPVFRFQFGWIYMPTIFIESVPWRETRSMHGSSIRDWHSPILSSTENWSHRQWSIAIHGLSMGVLIVLHEIKTTRRRLII